MRKIVLSIAIAAAALSLGGCGQENNTSHVAEKESPTMQGDLFANESGDVVLVERRLNLQAAFIAEKWKPLSTTERAIGTCKGLAEEGVVIVFCKATKEYLPDTPAAFTPSMKFAARASLDAADAPKLIQEAIQEVNAEAAPMVNPTNGK